VTPVESVEEFLDDAGLSNEIEPRLERNAIICGLIATGGVFEEGDR